jgi:hypothetical protein
MPQTRRDSCQGDFSNASWSWDNVLEPHWRTAQPRMTITVRYQDGGERFATIEKAMRFIALLETVADRSSETFAWRAPFTIEAAVCGRSHAEWNPARRTLTVCYELAQEFAFLYQSYETEPMVSQR